MSSPMVSTAWLAARLDEPGLRIVELRGAVLPPTEPPPHYLSDLAGYEAAHIPGAFYVDWQADINEPGSPSHDVASPERYAALMSRLGIDADTSVVVYDNAAGMFACRFRWTLRYYGHERVRVLDGGWDKWVAEGLPVSSEVPQAAATTFVPRPNKDLIATGADVLAAISKSDLQLIDVRSPAEYRGAASRAKEGGHIPGAINLPRGTMLNADNTLKSAAELSAVFAESGIAIDARATIVYCNSGVSATYGMLALEVAGARNLRLYDSSWKEWGNDETLPKTTIPAAGM